MKSEPERKIGVTGWKVWLPILLSLVPLLVLHQEAATEARIALSNADQNWYSETEPVARMVSESSHPRFWVAAGLREMKRSVEKGKKAANPGTLAQDLQDSLKRISWNVRPQWKLWAIVLPDGPNGKFSFVTNPGFSSTGKALVGPVLHEIVKAQIGSSSQGLDREPFLTRLPRFFGGGISSAHFLPSMQGKVFSGVMDGQPGEVIWDVIFSGKQIVGLLVAFQPRAGGDEKRGIRWAIANWKARGLFPAYLPLPVSSKPAKIRFFHPRFRSDPTLRELLKNVRASFQFSPAPQPNGDDTPRLRLPLAQINRSLSQNGWRYRLIPLDVYSGHLGILCQRQILPPPGPIAQAEKVALLIVLIPWLFTLIFFLWFRRIPALGVRFQLLLWFFGVIAVPALLGFTSGIRMLADHQQTLINDKQRDLETALTAIDRESSRIPLQQERICRDLFQQPWLVEGVRACQFQGKSAVPLLEAVAKKVQEKFISPQGLCLFGFRNYFQSWPKAQGHSVDQMVIETLRGAWGDRIASATPPIPLERFPLPTDSKQSMASLFFKQALVGMNTSNIMDRVNEFIISGATFWQFCSKLQIKGETWFTLVMSWSQQAAYENYLREQLKRIMGIAGAPRLLALRISTTPRLVIPQNAPSGLKQMAWEARQGPVRKKMFLNGHEHLLFGFPSRRLEGYVLAGMVSLRDVELEMVQERDTLLIIFFCGLSLTGLVALLLSHWLASPIVRMSQGLTRISEGDLQTKVAEHRQDELGQAGETVDLMTHALHERQALTRFVHPQVLKIATQGGDFSQASHGHYMQVTVLSSDIRNFTTLSETYPPNQVFQTLNRHFEVMTAVIQEQGGIIDRFIGDAIIAIFPEMPSTASSSQRAVRAALTMTQAHQNLVKERQARGFFAYSMGIGLESGEVLTGILGDPDVRLDFTVLGETVSRAGEYEGLSKQGRSTRIVGSDSLRRAAGTAFQWEPLPGSSHLWELQSATQSAGDPSPLPVISSGPAKPPPNIPSPKKDDSLSPATVLPDSISVDHTSDSVSPGRWQFISALGPVFTMILLWGLPLGMISLSLFGFYRSEEEGRSKEGYLRLRDDFRFFEQSFDPAILLSYDLRNRLRLAQRRAELGFVPKTPNCDTPSVAFSGDTPHRGDTSSWEFRRRLAQEVKRIIAPLEKKFPSLYWFHDHSQPPLPEVFARFESVSPAGSAPLTLTTIGSMTSAGWQTHSRGRVIDLFAGPSEQKNLSVDNFVFAWQPLQGNGTFTVRVADILDADNYFRPGIFLRENSSPGSRYAGIALRADTGPLFSLRLKENRHWTWQSFPAFISPPPGEPTAGVSRTPPSWLRLARIGNSVRSWDSPDGQTWKYHAKWVFPASETVQIGVGLFGQQLSLHAALQPQEVEFGGCLPSALDDESRWRMGAEWRLSTLNLIEEGVPYTPSQMRWASTRNPFTDWRFFPPFLNPNARRLAPVRLTGKNGYLYFHPIFSSDATPPKISLRATVSRGSRTKQKQGFLQKAEEFHRSLQGIFWLGMDFKDLSFKETLPILFREMKRRGVTTSLARNRGRALPLIRLPDLEDQVRVSGTIFREGRPYLVTLSREKGKKPRGSLQDLFWVFLGSVWGLGGLSVAFLWLREKDFPTPRLLRQVLYGGFLLATIPTLFTCWSIMERSHQEAKIRIIQEQRDRLLSSFQTLETLDPIYEGWPIAFFRHLSRQKNFMKAISQPTLHPTKTSPVSRGLELMKKQSENRIFRLSGLKLIDSNTVAYPSSEFGHEASNEAITRILLELNRKTSSLLNTVTQRNSSANSGGRGGLDADTIIAAEMDSAQRSLTMLTGTQELASLLNAPEYSGKSSLTGKRTDSLFRMMMWEKDKVLGDMHISYGDDALLPYFMQTLVRSGFESFPDLTIIPCSREYPLWLPIPPGQKRQWHESGLFLVQRFLAPQTPGWFELISLAGSSQEVTIRDFGEGKGRRLIMAWPGRAFDGWIFAGEIPLGKLLFELAAELPRLRIALFLVFLLALLLAHTVANRFLKPVAEFVVAAHQVRDGDYTARLPYGQNDEFGMLATAFNRMASAAGEGKLLGRFVSASARGIAGDDDRSIAAKSGEAREVMILFAGIGGFKDLLKTCPPDRLIVWLNHYLKLLIRFTQGSKKRSIFRGKLFFRLVQQAVTVPLYLYANCFVESKWNQLDRNG